MQATASPGETQGEFSGIAAEVAIEGGRLCRGRGKIGVPMTCFKGAVWWGTGTQGGGTRLCTLLAAPDTHSPFMFFVHMLPRTCDHGDVPFGDRQQALSPAVLITNF